MDKVIVYRIENITERCVNCTEYRNCSYAWDNNHLPVCDDCANKTNVVKLSFHEYKVYLVLISNELKDENQFRKVISAKLGIGTTSVGNTIRRLIKKGAIVSKSRKKNFVINNKGERVSLSNYLVRVLNAVNSPKALLTFNYVGFAAEELNLKPTSLRALIKKLRREGFNIPSATERKNNLIAEIEKVFNSHEWVSHKEIYSIIKTKSYCSYDFCEEVVMRLNKNTNKPKHSVKHEIIKVLDKPKTADEIMAETGHSRVSVVRALSKMKKQVKNKSRMGLIAVYEKVS